MSPEEEFAYEYTATEGEIITVQQAMEYTQDWKDDTLYPSNWGESERLMYWDEAPDWKVVRYSRRGEEVIIAFLKDRNGLPYLDGAYIEECDESYAARYSIDSIPGGDCRENRARLRSDAEWAQALLPSSDTPGFVEEKLREKLRQLYLDTAAKLRPEYLKEND